MRHFFVNAAGSYIPEWNVFLAVPFLDYFFRKAPDTPQVHSYVCNTMANKCGFDVDASGPCQERLDSLPVFSNENCVDGKDKGCKY